jgi:hypothetical protein
MKWNCEVELRSGMQLNPTSKHQQNKSAIAIEVQLAEIKHLLE